MNSDTEITTTDRTEPGHPVVLSQGALSVASMTSSKPRIGTVTTQGLTPSVEEAALDERTENPPGNADASAAREKAPADVSMDVDDTEGTDTLSREPTPWPESWYEWDVGLGFRQFAAKVMAECHSQNPTTSNPGNEQAPMCINTAAPSANTSSTVQEPTRNESRTNVHETTQTGPSGSQTAHRRSRDDGEAGEDDDDVPNPKRQRVMRPPPDEASRGSLYACPIQKRYPKDSPFCGMPHGSRRGYGWNTISRVK